MAEDAVEAALEFLQASGVGRGCWLASGVRWKFGERAGSRRIGGLQFDETPAAAGRMRDEG